METKNENTVNNNFSTFSETFRPLWGGLVGLILALFMSYLFHLAAVLYFDAAVSSSWEALLWGNEVIRTLASLVVSFAAAFVTGMVARRKGGLTGLVITIPSSIYWLLYLIGLIQGRYDFFNYELELQFSVKSLIIALVLVFGNLIAGYMGGEMGKMEVDSRAQSFDSTPKSFLGIKWYHYFWIPIVVPLSLFPLMLASFYLVDALLNSMTLSEYDISSILPNLISTIASIPIYIIYKGTSNAYEILTEKNSADGRLILSLAVILYTIVFPLVSFAIIVGLDYIIIFVNQM